MQSRPQSAAKEPEGPGEEGPPRGPAKAPEFDPAKEAPKLIVVHGPAKSGKSTLIRSLVKHYTGQGLKEVRGPVTVRTSNKQRVTFVETGPDIASLVDLAKVPDIVLSVIGRRANADVSIGFEMETFEFLSVLQIHGFPRLLGVATHLDHLRDNKQKKKMQKSLRRRFQVEVPPESKLFFVKSLKKGLYDFRDVHNLSRFISVINPRPLAFKRQHPHVLVDRVERSGARALVFGYVRGADFVRDQNDRQLLLSGLGMVGYAEALRVHDPCPVGELGQKKGLRKHDKKLYAPQSNIGLALFDETGDYVQIPEKHVVFTAKEGQDAQVAGHEGVQMMRGLQTGLDEESAGEVELVEGLLVEGDSEPEGRAPGPGGESAGALALKVHREYAEDSAAARPKDSRLVDLNRVVYEAPGEAGPSGRAPAEFSRNSSAYLHRKREQERGAGRGAAAAGFLELALQSCEDSAFFYPASLEEASFYEAHTKRRFATGFEANGSGAEASAEEGSGEEAGGESSVDLEDYASDEEALEAEREGRVEQMKSGDARLLAKGSYVRLELAEVPPKVFRRFLEEPVILSQLAPGESQMGFLMVKFKKHRFYRNLLKTGDPLVVSLNFAKFQTVPYFCRKDPGLRLRMLKYTPRHEFCLAVFFGNYAPNQTGVVAFQTLGSR